MFAEYAVRYRLMPSLRIAAEDSPFIAVFCMIECAREGYNEGLQMIAHAMAERGTLIDDAYLQRVRARLRNTGNTEGLAILRDAIGI